MKNTTTLTDLLSNDGDAKKYFYSLPDYVQETIRERGDNINSFDSMRDYAENLTRGDR